MARKRRKSNLDVLLDLVSMLPWWAGVAIAVIGYVFLHRMALQSQTMVPQQGTISEVMVQSVISGFALAGQYIVPLVGLTGAAISFFRRKQRTALVVDVAQAHSASVLDGMSWREFELLVGEAFKLKGYRVAQNGGGGPDGGIDIVMTKGNERFLVQCKQWKAFKVGVDVIRELYGVMAAKGATGGFVVTSGRFTDDAKAFADGRNIELLDGPKLFQMIKQAKQSLAATAHQPVTKGQMTKQTASSAPSCPQCGSGMVKRVGRKGRTAGTEFWGCTKFPSCRGVRQVTAPVPSTTDDKTGQDWVDR